MCFSSVRITVTNVSSLPDFLVVTLAGAKPPEKDPSMTVAALLKQKPYNVVIVRPKDRIFDVVHGLAKNKIGVAVVMEGHSLVGIISERDVMRGLDDKGSELLEVTVDQHMVRDVWTCSPRTTVDQAIALMTKGRFRHLPVMDEGKLLGVISIRLRARLNPASRAEPGWYLRRLRDLAARSDSASVPASPLDPRQARCRRGIAATDGLTPVHTGI
jgi:CBS domain-containing protein